MRSGSAVVVIEQPHAIWSNAHTEVDDLECGCRTVVLPLWTSDAEPGALIAKIRLNHKGIVCQVHVAEGWAH